MQPPPDPLAPCTQGSTVSNPASDLITLALKTRTLPAESRAAIAPRRRAGSFPQTQLQSGLLALCMRLCVSILREVSCQCASSANK